MIQANIHIDMPKELWDSLSPDDKSALVFNAFHSTPDQKRLIDKVESFAGLFGDMRFLPETCTGSLRKITHVYATGKEEEEILPIPNLTLRNFDYIDYRFIVFEPGSIENEETLGYFKPEIRELGIRSDKLDSDDIILHELIHLHEDVFDHKSMNISPQRPEDVDEDVEDDKNVPLRYRDMLFWTLYLQVKKQIPQLDALVLSHALLWNDHKLTEQGGDHSILFLLKSLDLDLRKGYRLGTIFGYDRTELYKDYSYEPYEEE